MKHGTRYGYKQAKCRCDGCKAWNTAESQRYWRRRALAGRPRPNGWGSYNDRRAYQEAA